MTALVRFNEHRFFRYRSVPVVGSANDIVAVITCDINTLWAIGHAFSARDSFGRELTSLASKIAEEMEDEDQ